MGLEAVSGQRERERESVIVVIDANRNKGSVDALDWALKHVVRRRDSIIILGVLYEFGKKNYSCFPLNMGINISHIWERLDFSGQGHEEARPRELGEEIERKREQYQNNLLPYYRQCKKNEVKWEAKLAFGFCPQKITVEQAQIYDPHWVVLDSHLKKYKTVIYGHLGCNVAVMKGKDVATLMPSRAPHPEKQPLPRNGNSSPNNCLQPGESSSAHQGLAPSQSPCWYPLSWRSGYPRAFSQAELQVITNGFADENIVQDEDNIKVYEGILQETPVLVKSFLENDKRFWTMLKILSRIRHRNIMNLVGYCCTGTSMFLLCDFPCMGTVEMNFQCDDLARELSWKARWYIALEIGGSLRYLHEECVDGAIVHHSVCSASVVFSHGCTTMLGSFFAARCLKDNDEESESEWGNMEESEHLSIDVRDYGVFLIELITGKSSRLFQNQGEMQSLTEWALPLLENGSMNKLLDPRLEDATDTRVVHYMANAALQCLKSNYAHRLSISEVLAIVRGDQLAMAKC